MSEGCEVGDQAPASTRQALTPPNPNEFESATTFADRRGASPPRHRRQQSGIEVGRGPRSAGRGRCRSRPHRDDGFDGARAADHVAGRSLHRGDRRRRTTEQGGERGGLGGIVQRGRGAVGVDVGDRPGVRPASASASRMHAAHPRRRGSEPRGGGRRHWCRSRGSCRAARDRRRGRRRVGAAPRSRPPRRARSRHGPRRRAATRGPGRRRCCSSRRVAGTSRWRCR